MSDFVSQSTLDSGFLVTPDSLDHTGFAQSVLETALRMPRGSVIALQGPWGRGKTDVLTRVVDLLRRKADEDALGAIDRPIWINPWQYGTPDLLTPLVIELLGRIPKERRQAAAGLLRRAAESIVRAGASFGLKAASVTLPAGQLLDMAAQPLDTLLAGLFDASKQQAEAAPDADPVAKMAERFRELVAAVLEHAGDGRLARLVICVDDLDRCLPHRQVALLEALRFLSSSGAAATVLVALDPTLARQAVVTHYGTDTFDPDLYLDKMFHLRISLPAMSPLAVQALVMRELDTRELADGKRSLGDWMTGQPSPFTIRGVADDWDWPPTQPDCRWPAGFPLEASTRHAVVAQAFAAALQVQELRSPRLITRMLERIEVLANHGPLGGEPDTAHPAWMSTPVQLGLFTLWLAMAERWPTVRAAMQAAGPSTDWGDRLREIFVYYWPPTEMGEAYDEAIRKTAESLPAVIEQLPDAVAAPGLRQCLLQSWQLFNRDTLPTALDDSTHPIPGAFDGSLRCDWLAARWADFDRVLVRAGL